ncbi:MAG: membrane protein insertion efficiency factor YidD [Bacteroidales bacterium]
MRRFIIIVFLAISFMGYGQTNDQIAEIQQTYTKPHNHTHEHNYKKEYSNELEFITFNLFLFYKKYVSSQDASSCSFTPSCSVYAVQALKSQGMIMGLINFFDRFSRCNSLSPEDYPSHSETQLLYDPVKDFSYEPIDEEK